MKNLIKRHVRLLVLTLAFLLSGAIPANSQNIYFKDKDTQQISLFNNKADVSDLVQPFYCGVDDNIFSLVEGQEYTISKTPITISDAKFGNIVEQDIIENNSKLSKALTLRIDEKEDSKILCCNIVAVDWIYNNTITFTIAVHDMPLVEEKPATCTSDGYRKYKCACCKEERTETLYALGHSYGEWQEMAGGHMRTCSHDANHKQYNMDATGVNALEITLTDDTKLSYPSTLSPVVTFNELDVAIGFDTDKTSLVNKADIKEYNQVWSHNKNGYAKNDDNTYSHACDYTNCDYKHDDLFVKNGAQYYVAENKNGVIRVADMTLNDTEGYDCEADFTATHLTYNRTFSNGYWQAVYVPFAIDCSKLPADMEMAVINNFHEYEQEDGSYNVVLEVKRKTSGTIPALTPCVIRMKTAPAEAIEKPLYFSDAEFYAAADKFIDCSSVTRYYKFIGTLAGKTAGTMKDGEDFVLNLGTLYKANGETTLNPQRWYLTATDRNGSSTSATMLRSISLSVIGDSDGDVTGIENVHVVTEKATSVREGIFDLQGRRLNSEPTNGIYIKNGVKYVK